jgi:hypothetical protein
MNNLLCALLLVVSSVSICFAQRTKTITTTSSDPASVSLDALFAQADVVAVVQIRSGDAENYDVAVYKAIVLTSYKGTKANEVIYYTPFISYGLGSEYLVFLKKTDNRIADIIPKDVKEKNLPYDGKQAFYRVMYDGYSVMPVSFECIFEKPAHEHCTYAVKFNIKQVKLPSRLKTYPRVDKDREVLDVKYVKKSDVKSILESWKKS